MKLIAVLAGRTGAKHSDGERRRMFFVLDKLSMPCRSCGAANAMEHNTRTSDEEKYKINVRHLDGIGVFLSFGSSGPGLTPTRSLLLFILPSVLITCSPWRGCRSVSGRLIVLFSSGQKHLKACASLTKTGAAYGPLS